MKSGIVERGELLAKVGEVWQIPSRTLDRYYAIAKDKYSVWVLEFNKKKDAAMLEIVGEQMSDTVVSRKERLEIASQIARGELKSGAFYPSFGDRIKALEYLSKIEGDFAPKKIEHEFSKGIKMTIEEIKEISDALDGEV